MRGEGEERKKSFVQSTFDEARGAANIRLNQPSCFRRLHRQPRAPSKKREKAKINETKQP